MHLSLDQLRAMRKIFQEPRFFMVTFSTYALYCVIQSSRWHGGQSFQTL